MSDFVLDASIAAAWLLPDEESEVASIAFAKLVSGKALVPAIWRDEINNILLVCERRGRISAEQSAEALSLLGQLPIELVTAQNGARIMQFGRQHGLSAYDAAYLSLAIEERLPLASLDSNLRTAAMAEKVALIGS